MQRQKLKTKRILKSVLWKDEQSPETVFVLELNFDDENINNYDNIEECYGMQVINLSLQLQRLKSKYF